MNHKLINFVAFQLGWFACVLSAANGMPWLGLLVAGLIVVIHLQKAARPAREAQLVFLAVLAGLIFDSLLVLSGWLQYPGGTLVPGIAPYWILAMWALFATTLNASMSWLKSSLLLASVMGAIFGPLSYVAGQRLGALEFINFPASMIALSFIWALAMPLLMYAANRSDDARWFVPIVPLQKLPEEK
jgi:hypothetical protein